MSQQVQPNGCVGCVGLVVMFIFVFFFGAYVIDSISDNGTSTVWLCWDKEESKWYEKTYPQPVTEPNSYDSDCNKSN